MSLPGQRQRPRSIRLGQGSLSGAKPTTLSKYAYRNDILGRRTSVVQTGLAFASQPWHYRFGYNDRSELTGADRFEGTDPDQDDPLPPRVLPRSQFEFDYDHIGNRRTAAVDSSTTAYTINNLLNQYDATTSPAAAFGYDDDGNLTDDGRYTYTWDAENRLIALERKLPRADGDKRLTFQYDYLGRRVRKQVFAWATDHWQLATDESFIYNGWEVIEVVDALAGATGELLIQYTWGLDLSGGLQGAGGIGGLLACEWPQTTGESKKYWFFYDANGNVGQLLRYRTTGGESITPAARYEYDPYGNTLAAVDMDAQSDPGAAAANPFRFSTKWLDHEPATTNPAGAVGTTGLYYYGYRYYSPGLGRWISRDPIGEPGAMLIRHVAVTTQFIPRDPIDKNGYVAMRNDPIKWFDPDGAEAQTQPANGTYVPCKVCCASKLHSENGIGPTLIQKVTVTVPQGKTKAQACEEAPRTWRPYEDTTFLHSGPCDKPCDGKPKVPLWICGRPLDITGLGWSYYIGIKHGYICCDGPNKGCRNFWETTTGRTRVSQEAICTGKCVKIDVCPEEKAEKCQGQNWRQPYSTTCYNCNDWKWNFGNTTCAQPGQQGIR